MTRLLSASLSGFMIVQSGKAGDHQQLIVECRIPEWDQINLVLRLLDKNRQELTSVDCQQMLSGDEQFETTELEKIPHGARYHGARKIFRDRKFCCVHAEFLIPEGDYKNCVYFALSIGKVTGEDTSTPSNKQWQCQPDCIHFETDRRELRKKDSGAGAMFLLITQEQASLRMEELLQKFPRLRWLDQVTSDAVASLWIHLFGGVSPLLTESFMNRKKIERIIYGAIKFASKNVFRDRVTRSKNRQVGPEFLADLASPAYDPSDPIPGEVDSHQLEIALRHVEEVAGKYEYAELLRRAIEGELVSALAVEMGINTKTARVRVCRGRNRLNLPSLQQASRSR